MRLEIERGELLKALSHVTSVVERRTTIPILSNIMLKASGETLDSGDIEMARAIVMRYGRQLAAVARKKMIAESPDLKKQADCFFTPRSGKRN